MLRSLKGIQGYRIQATDGEIGTVTDFLFDDGNWKIRYVVVDTGDWLPGRKVLLSPESLKEPDWNHNRLPVSLSKERIKNSPGIEEHEPVSRRYERELARYYMWPVYWSAAAPLADASQTGVSESDEVQKGAKAECHLRSAEEVEGYHIQAQDGEIGHMEDFVAEDGVWVIRYTVVETRNWLPGRRVLIAPAWIDQIEWDESKVHVQMTREEIKESPEFDPIKPINRKYEKVLYDYYGRPKYWENSEDR